MNLALPSTNLDVTPACIKRFYNNRKTHHTQGTAKKAPMILLIRSKLICANEHRIMGDRVIRVTSYPDGVWREESNKMVKRKLWVEEGR